MELVYLLCHVAVTLVAVVGLALRLEHRITKIETDVKWLTAHSNPGKKGVDKNVTNS